MNHHDYRIHINANITASEAFKRINAVSDWWAKDFTGRSQQLGDTFTVRFGNTFVDFKITEVVPDERVIWKVIDSHLPWLQNKDEWTGTTVVWEVTQVNGITQIGMTHVGLVPDVECYGKCELGWNFYVGESLRKLMAENVGMPDGRSTCNHAAA